MLPAANNAEIENQIATNIITKLEIEKFRGFVNEEMSIGKNITIIFGKNGCLKSTLLGMIAQPFYFSEGAGKKTLYTDDYKRGTPNESPFPLQINGNKFEAEYSRIFRMSETDIASHTNTQYKYFLKIEGAGVHLEKKFSGREGMLQVRSQHHRETATTKRFRLVGGASSNRKGTGNFPHPIIYLGLNRLFPMALSSLDEAKKIELSEDEKRWFEQKYSYILSSNLSKVSVTSSSPTNADKPPYLLHSDDVCNFKSVSAGQDNVGQIVSSALSFRRLKEKLADSYRGGMLLIDEIEATLHPVSQKKLLEFLVQVSDELQLQIIATSHSTQILDAAFNSQLSSYITPVHITQKSDGGYYHIQMPKAVRGYNKIKFDLYESFGIKMRKLLVFVEDPPASQFLKSILGKEISSNIIFSNEGAKIETASSSYLLWLASYKSVSSNMRCLFVVDGDQRKNVARKKLKNLLCLMGDESPEKLLYEYFSNPRVWETAAFDFNQATCFSGFRDSDLKVKYNSKQIDFYKAWFKNMAEPGRFGRLCAAGFKLYCENHKNEVHKFRLDFCKSAVEVLSNPSYEYADVYDFFKNYVTLHEEEIESSSTYIKKISVDKPNTKTVTDSKKRLPKKSCKTSAALSDKQLKLNLKMD